MDQYGSRSCPSMQSRCLPWDERYQLISLFVGSFTAKLPTNKLSLLGSRQAKEARFQNLASLYHQIMGHFESTNPGSTVDFDVPDLNAISEMDMEDLSAKEAIVQMNALVLGVHVHSQKGLQEFRRITADEEDRLEADMLRVGANKPASVNRDKNLSESECCHFNCHPSLYCAEIL
jgi:hypothetical protein